MTINAFGWNLGWKAPYHAMQLVDAQRQFDELQRQLVTGKKSDSYAGQGAGRGFAVELRGRLDLMQAYADSATNVTTRVGLVSLSLQGLSDIAARIGTSARNIDLTLNANGQTTGQVAARGAFADALSLLNSDAGGRYLFSGRALDTPATAGADEILDGEGMRAGLRQIIAERRQADIGSGLGNGIGRVVLTMPAVTAINLAEDVAGSPFGMKLDGVASTLTGVVVTGPAGSPLSIGLDLAAASLSDGESITLSFALPDGSRETIELTAKSAAPFADNTFEIGTDAAASSANLNAALDNALGRLAQTSLVAASAMAAADDFFRTPAPLRVDGPPFDSAVAQIDGTPQNTVMWYRGEGDGGAARATAVVKIDSSVSVSYGARANENAIRHQLQTFAVYSVFAASPADPHAKDQLSELNSRVGDALSSGAASLQGMQAEFAGVQVSVKMSTERQQQSKAIAQAMLDAIENVPREEVIARILALQTSLTASYQTTAMLSRNSLVNYL